MSNSWRTAVEEDGLYVVYQATSRLYQGTRLRPDVYYMTANKLGGLINYRRTFNDAQRQVLESYPHPRDYDIRVAASSFDMTLHIIVLQKLCGLSQASPLYKNLAKIVEIWEAEISTSGCDAMPEDELNDMLNTLLGLYLQTLNYLEDRVRENLEDVKQEVRRRIIRKMTKETVKKKEGMDNWEKAVIGVGAGCVMGVGFGLLGALVTSPRQGVQDKKEDSERFGAWCKTGIKVGACIGVLGALASMDLGEEATEEDSL